MIISNSYLSPFYHMKPGPSGIDVTYGRIGSDYGEMFGKKNLLEPYPSRLFWIRYYEKLSKGYIDQSDIFLGKQLKKTKKPKKTKTSAIKTVSNPTSEELYELLMSYARHVVKQNLVSDIVTKKQVSEAKRCLKEAGKRKTVKAFNKWIMKVIVLTPRKERYIDTLLASSSNDFKTIIEREEDLVAAMEAVATGNIPERRSTDSFDDFNIEVYPATSEQKDKVLSKLGDSLKGKVSKVWRIIPKDQKSRFDAYLKKNNIKRVKELWHGSRNENWFSILQNSLKLHPNAQITGKMFGQGIYFAPSSAKSFNYTSFRGTTWASGKSDKGYMALCATAYGKPLDVYSHSCGYEQSVKNAGANCLHAHAGSMLLNDEIVFYNEDAILINYLVEFSA